MTPIRVLVVEDSATVRRHLVDALEADPAFEVVGEAGDGKAAIELCQRLRPDVISLDMMLPVMTGIAATEFVMAYCPTPILVVSSSTNRGELFRTYDALAAGAVDVLDKPRGDEPHGEWERRYRDAVRLVARIRVITHVRARLGSSPVPAATPTTSPAHNSTSPTTTPQIITIGVSTGGPAALVRILHALPVGFAIPLVAVMHLGDPFASTFAEWLDAQTRFRVRYAVEGESVQATAGRMILAPADRHLLVRGGRLHLVDDAPRHSCRPSVDVLFDSVAAEYGSRALACLLTGMGRDGASGLLSIRAMGGHTIAQDEATSVVYGMPREAALLGAAAQVLSLDAIATTIADRHRRAEDKP